MWSTTRKWNDTDSEEVTLLRDDLVVAVVSMEDWWIMSATRHLADKALEENDLDFRASEVFGPESPRVPEWTADLTPSGNSHDVHLLHNGAVIAVLGLDEWAELPVNKYIVTDHLEAAWALSDYGSNIEEVREAIAEDPELSWPKH